MGKSFVFAISLLSSCILVTVTAILWAYDDVSFIGSGTLACIAIIATLLLLKDT